MTEHFTLKEFLASDKALELGIDNSPPWEMLQTIKKTCEGLEKIRALTGHPITILSGYRCKELNTVVGGSVHSQHMKGEAADIVCRGYGSPLELALLIEEHMIALGVDQVINERDTWVHCSFTDKPRHQSMSLKEDVGYTAGIT